MRSKKYLIGLAALSAALILGGVSSTGSVQAAPYRAANGYLTRDWYEEHGLYDPYNIDNELKEDSGYSESESGDESDFSSAAENSGQRMTPAPKKQQHSRHNHNNKKSRHADKKNTKHAKARRSRKSRASAEAKAKRSAAKSSKVGRHEHARHHKYAKKHAHWLPIVSGSLIASVICVGFMYYVLDRDRKRHGMMNVTHLTDQGLNSTVKTNLLNHKL